MKKVFCRHENQYLQGESFTELLRNIYEAVDDWLSVDMQFSDEKSGV